MMTLQLLGLFSLALHPRSRPALREGTDGLASGDARCPYSRRGPIRERAAEVGSQKGIASVAEAPTMPNDALMNALRMYDPAATQRALDTEADPNLPLKEWKVVECSDERGRQKLDSLSSPAVIDWYNRPVEDQVAALHSLRNAGADFRRAIAEHDQSRAFRPVPHVQASQVPRDHPGQPRRGSAPNGSPPAQP